MGLGSKAYTIEFNKLQHGLNKDEFILDQTFMEAFEFSPVKAISVTAAVEIDKSENMYGIEIALKGCASVSCDNCLVSIELPVHQNFSFLIKMSEANNFDNPDMIYLNRNEIGYDLKQYLYESVLLSLPTKRDCDGLPEPKPCDKTVLNKFSDNNEDDENVDPRWDKLKDILK
jgi:uncharacterized protein